MKIIKQSLEEQAATFLREQILNNKYAMEEKLTESQLAKNLELSRSTIRMVLNTIAHEGLIIQKPYVGWHVINLNEQDLLELYNLRMALETRSACLAAENITEEGRSQLRDLMKYYLKIAHKKDVTGRDISRMDLELHTLIIELSHNMRFNQIYKNMANQVLIYLNIDHTDHDPILSAESHVSLVEAICSGDRELASKLAEENITTYTVIGDKFKKTYTANR